MAKKKSARPPLLMSVLMEIGRGRITEAFITAKDAMVSGLAEGSGQITINPAFDVVDTVIHEVLHRLHPEWSERYVKRTTTYLMRRMTDDEIRTVYEEYCRRVQGRAHSLSVKSAD